MSAIEKVCTHLVHFDKGASANEIKDASAPGQRRGGLGQAAGDEELRPVVMMLLNGETLPGIMMFIAIVHHARALLLFAPLNSRINSRTIER